MPQVTEGQKAPNFKLSDKDGKVHQPLATEADYTVLFFYPKDSTPGCTLEAQEFTATLREFTARKARVIGVSGGDDASKAKFCSKYKLSVPLVSDTTFKVAQAYGAFGEKQFMGRKFKGIFRKTFILNRSGTIVRVFDSVKPAGHAQEVLDAIDELSNSAGSRKRTPVGAKVAAAKKEATKKARPQRAVSRPRQSAATRSRSRGR
jgi:thioredoxin-dependent peroxiredoxin